MIANETTILSSIRPLFEYGCEEWDNCGVANTELLEKLQREAARIVTGLPYYCNSEMLYSETAWESFSDNWSKTWLMSLNPKKKGRNDIFHKQATTR